MAIEFRDTLHAEMLLQSLTEYWEAKRIRDEAYANYTGYSPGWALSEEDNAVSRKAAAFEDALNRVVEEKVMSILKRGWDANP